MLHKKRVDIYINDYLSFNRFVNFLKFKPPYNNKGKGVYIFFFLENGHVSATIDSFYIFYIEIS